MVQSEEERQLRKQVRREEKKIQKLLGKLDIDSENGAENGEFQFDPIDLRTKRQAALANAMNQPIFKEKSEAPKASYQQEQYPFVFDSYGKTKSSAGNDVLAVMKQFRNWQGFSLIFGIAIF